MNKMRTNSNLLVAAKIREAFYRLPSNVKLQLLEQMSESEIINRLVDIFFEEIEQALVLGYHPARAEDMAFKQSMRYMEMDFVVRS